MNYNTAVVLVDLLKYIRQYASEGKIWNKKVKFLHRIVQKTKTYISGASIFYSGYR